MDAVVLDIVLKVTGALLFFFQSFYFLLASFWRVSIIMSSSSLTLFFCCLQSAIKPNQWNVLEKILLLFPLGSFL